MKRFFLCFCNILQNFRTFAAENCEQEQYGEERIIELLTSHSSSNCRDIIEALKADTDEFRDGAEQNDDLTMLAIRTDQV